MRTIRACLATLFEWLSWTQLAERTTVLGDIAQALDYNTSQRVAEGEYAKWVRRRQTSGR